MRSAIERLYGRIKAGSSVLFFFSGYGIQTDRQTYLLPVNAQIWTEAEVRRDGMAIDTILAEMNVRGATVKLAIIEASRRNPFERRFRGVSMGLAPVTAPHGSLIMSAAAPGALVNEGGGQHSLFVSELLKEMRSPGLSIEAMFDRTRIGVRRASRGEQVPWVSSSLLEDFYLSQPKYRSPEAEDYAACEQQATRQCWETFLKTYESGSYADRSRKNLEAGPGPKPVEATPYDETIKRNPKVGDNYYRRGVYYAQKRRYPEAINDFDQAIRLNPGDAEAFNNLCWTRGMTGDLEGALRDCNQALKLRRNFVNALDSRGLVNLKMGLPNSAIADYTAALRLNPKHASALFGRGKAKLQNGDRSGGEADISAAQSIDPEIAQAFESDDAGR
jgi:tetratricopeptide (TPR) repeat protein